MSRYKQDPFTGTVTSIEDAFSDLQGLLDELQEGLDNMTGTNLEHTSKYNTYSDAVDALSQCVDAPEVPDELQDVSVSYSLYRQGRRGLPRWARRDNAVAILRAAIDALMDVEGEHQEAAEELAQELEEAAEIAEGVEFPGFLS